MGALWKVRKRMKSTLGSSAGAAAADTLFNSWMIAFDDAQITTQIELHWLILDDDDANLANGTPNFFDIDGGFRDQGFPGFAPPAPVVYCTAKAGLACGTPAIGWTGTASASATSGFELFAGPARAAKAGLLLYTVDGRAALPFQGGLLCLAPGPALSRSVPIGSGGSAGGCDGELRIDMNAFAQGLLGGNPRAFLRLQGTLVQSQLWGRDSVATGSFLSDAVEYTVAP